MQLKTFCPSSICTTCTHPPSLLLKGWCAFPVPWFPSAAELTIQGRWERMKNRHTTTQRTPVSSKQLISLSESFPYTHSNMTDFKTVPSYWKPGLRLLAQQWLQACFARHRTHFRGCFSAMLRWRCSWALQGTALNIPIPDTGNREATEAAVGTALTTAAQFT